LLSTSHSYENGAVVIEQSHAEGSLGSDRANPRVILPYMEDNSMGQTAVVGLCEEDWITPSWLESGLGGRFQ